jgi:peptidyl-prolyl cis-trans isomerase C
MKNKLVTSFALAALVASLSPLVSAQNIAIVNGKAVPLARAEALSQQVIRSGRQITPELEKQIKDEVIAREIFIQEAQKQGLDSTEDFRTQMELARQTILIRDLFANYQKTSPVTDAEIKAEYDRFAAANSGKEYKARPHSG